MNVDPIKVGQKTILSINIMKTKQIISGDVFIIPKCGILTPKGVQLEEMRHNLYTVAFANDIVFNDNTKFVQVWLCTPGESDSNWVYHRIDGYKELKGWKPRSSYLPVDLFAGKKEGDVVTINLPINSPMKYSIKGLDINPAGCKIPAGVAVEATIKVSLTLAQTKYRYRNFGNFDEVLLYLINRYIIHL